MLGSVPGHEGRVPGSVPGLDHAVSFLHYMKHCVFKFKLALIVPILSVCVVLAVASGERVDLSTISLPEAAMTKIHEHRGK